MSGERPIDPVDAIWLAMDAPTNLMVIDSIMWFDEPVDWDRLVQVLDRRVVRRFPVLSQRPAASPLPFGRPRWQDDPDFSLERHLVRATLPAPGGDAELRGYVEAQVHRPLDRDHPLWQLHLIDGYREGAAVLTRFHHALADGMALGSVLLSMTDATPGAAVQAPPGDPVHHSGRGMPGALDLLTAARRSVHVAGKLLLGSNPSTPLSGTLGTAKRVTWSGPTPLAEVKQAGRLAGASVNDVVLTAVSAAISELMTGQGTAPVDVTTMVPVNLRAPGALPPELGNRFALVLLTLPTGPWTLLQRLSETKARMDAIKSSPEATITFGTSAAIGLVPQRLETVLTRFFSSKAFGVTTNVAGPPSTCYLAGTAIAGTLGWAPVSGRQSLSVCIYTYDGSIRVGFKADAGLVPDPEVLVRAYDDALGRLLALRRLSADPPARALRI